MPNKKKKGFKRVPKETLVEVSLCSNQSSFRKQYTPLNDFSVECCLGEWSFN